MSNVKPKLVDEYNEDVSFSSLYKNIENALNSREEVKKIETVPSLTGDNQYIKVTYVNGKEEYIADQDRYVESITYDGGKLNLTRNDGASYSIDFGEQYYTKTEVDTKVETKVETEVAKQIDENVEDMVDKKVEEATSGITANTWQKF